MPATPVHRRLGSKPECWNISRVDYMKALGVRIEYIWHHTPQQNGHIGSFHGTLKREYIWPHEFARFQDAEEVPEGARRDYNNERIHSSLGYVTPDEFVSKWRKNRRERQNERSECAKNMAKISLNYRGSDHRHCAC